MNSIHAQLRTATRALHDEVEAVVGLPDRAETLDAYRCTLERFWGFHAPIEDALAAAPWDGFDFEVRRRAAAAAADLQALGLSPAAVETLPRRPAVTPATAAEAFGVLYVLEGSTLGGRVIRRTLEPRLPIAGAARFFDGRGPAAGRLWRELLEGLERRASAPAERAAAQAGAETTFRAMISWFG